MANGIMDTLTNIRRTGDPMGGPPVDPSMMAGAGGPPMGGPQIDPSMMAGGGLPVDPSMMAGGGGPQIDPSMMAGVGGGGPQIGEPEGEDISIEGDAAKLAETVFERAQGNIGTAVAILKTATDMLTQGAGAEGPMGGPPPMGPPMMANMGGPLYRDEGGTMSDADLLRQMIMSSLQSQVGRDISDVDLALGRTLSDRDRGQAGRTISTGDLRRYAAS